MSTIEFDEPEIHTRAIDISSAVTHNTPLLIKRGWVKDLRTANKIMLGIFIGCVVFSIGIFIYKSVTNKEIYYKEDFTVTELRGMLPDAVERLPAKPK